MKRRAQDAIQYEALTESGIAVLGDGQYSITLRLSDIDYQTSVTALQEELVERYAKFLTSFDMGQSVQVQVINRYLDPEYVRGAAELSLRGDDADRYRHAHNTLVRERIAEGRNNTVTDRYITLTIPAGDFEEASRLLARIEADASESLREIGGCRAQRISGEARVQLLQSLLRPSDAPRFRFEELVGSSWSTKDFVAPWAIDLKDTRSIVLGGVGDEVYMEVLCLREFPSWLSDQVIRELTDVPADIVVSQHLRPMSAHDGIELVKRQLAGMDMQYVNEKKKLRKQGMDDESLLPAELVEARIEAQDLLEQLKKTNEKLMSATILVGVRATSSSELAERVKQVRATVRKHSCELESLRYMQEDALNGILPLGVCRLPIRRTITTAVAAIMIPFTTQEIMVPGGIMYGVNRLSKNLVVGSRSHLPNGNAFVLGSSGYGKSMTVKAEVSQVLLGLPDDDVIVIDPEREYLPLAGAFGGQVVEVHASSTQSINPLELTEVADEGRSPIQIKAEFVLSMCEVLVGGATGLTPTQRSIIDDSTTKMYREFLAAKKNAAQPTLETLADSLRATGDPVAADLAAALALYATGSFSGFARHTTVRRQSRFTVFDTSLLGDSLKTFGMMVVLEQVWARVAENRAAGRRTWIYVDEFDQYFGNDYAAAFFQQIWQRIRKWGGYATGITQNIERVLGHDRARLMLANSAMVIVLSQSPTDASALQSLFGFSPKQRQMFSSVSPGMGLLRMGPDTVGFDNRIPTANPLYELFSTRFAEANV